MTQSVTMPDGTVHNFPDEATPEMISGALGLQQTESSTLQKAKSAAEEAFIGNATGNLPSPVLGSLEALGAGAGSLIKSASEPVIKNIANIEVPAAQNIANAIDSPESEKLAQQAKSGLQSIGSTISDIGKQYPEAARIVGIGNILPVGDIAETTANATRTVGDISGITSAIKSSSPMDFLKSTSSVPGEISTVPSIPSIRSLPDVTVANQKLAANTNALYKKADDLGFSFTPNGGNWLANSVRGAVEDATGGLDRQNHPGVIAALKTLDNKADSGLTLTGVDKVRQTLGRIAQNTNPDKANEVYAANKARAAIDNALSVAQNDPTLATGSSDAIEALNAARKAHALEIQHSDLRSIIRNANGNGNKIQSEFQKIYKDENGFNNLLPENQPLIQSVAQPGLGMNTAQAMGNLGFGAGGNKYALGSEAVAALLHPAAAPIVGPAMVAGTASNIIRNRIIRSAADQALRNIENASEEAYPLYGEPKASWLPTNQLSAPPIRLALPAPEPTYVAPRGPLTGARALSPEEAAQGQAQYQEYQNMGLDRPTMDAQQTARVSQYERENPANQAFNQLRENQAPISTSQTALHEPSARIGKNTFAPSNSAMSNAQYESAIQQNTPFAADTFSDNIFNKYGVETHLAQTPDGLYLAGIKNAGETGAGKQAMRYIISHADETGQKITTMPTNAYGTSINKLKDFYKSFGFEENSDGSMTRQPITKGFKRGGVVPPTEAQKYAGNYKKEHIRIHGLDISIENPKGSLRSGKDKNGKEWSVHMPHAYGYFKRTEGKDGDCVDCFVGPNHKSVRVYVIDQKNDKGGFDEHKVMLCFPTREAAIKAYRDSFSDKKNRIMHVRKMLIPEFKEWLKNGDTKKPIKQAA